MPGRGPRVPEQGTLPPAWPARVLVALFLASTWLARDHMVLESLHVYGTCVFVLLLYYDRLAHLRGKAALKSLLGVIRFPLHLAFLLLATHALWPAAGSTLLSGASATAWGAWWITAALAGVACLVLVVRNSRMKGR